MKSYRIKYYHGDSLLSEYVKTNYFVHTKMKVYLECPELVEKKSKHEYFLVAKPVAPMVRTMKMEECAVCGETVIIEVEEDQYDLPPVRKLRGD